MPRTVPIDHDPFVVMPIEHDPFSLRIEPVDHDPFVVNDPLSGSIGGVVGTTMRMAPNGIQVERMPLSENIEDRRQDGPPSELATAFSMAKSAPSVVLGGLVGALAGYGPYARRSPLNRR